MGHRVEGFGLLIIAVALTTAVWAVPTTPSAAATVCPPVTLADLVETTTTTSPPVTTPTTTTTGTPPTTTGALPPPSCDVPFVYSMTFPVMGGGGIGSPFGAARDGGRRLHAGNDLFAGPMQPIVAVANGTVTRIGADEGISGNRIVVRHDDGWSSYYIHLNNDTYGTDDANGVGVRSDLAVGDRVSAGQVIGWNGDSGNAEGSEKHLHFELHNPAGVAVDPGPSLRNARRAAPDGESAIAFDGPFSDHIWEGEGVDPLTLLLSRGAPVWCSEIGATSCPNEPATADDVSAWLGALIGPVTIENEATASPSGPIRTPDCLSSPACLARAEAAQPVTELDLARAIVWDRLNDAYELWGFPVQPGVPDTAWRTPTLPAPDHIFEVPDDETQALISAAGSCSRLPDPSQGLTRIQAAARIAELLGLGPAQCDLSAPANSNPSR